jgi:hypothetical protein
VRSGLHEAKAAILVNWRLVLRLRRGIVVDLDPAVAKVLSAMVMLLVHPNLAHHGIVHLIEAVDFQKHLKPWFWDDAECLFPPRRRAQSKARSCGGVD